MGQGRSRGGAADAGERGLKDRRSNMRFLLFFLLAICPGCATYHRGTAAGDGLGSIYVEPVKNSSLCPRASGPLTAQLTKKIQRSTSWKLADKNAAPSHLRVEIVDFQRKNFAYDPADTSKILSIKLVVAAECTLVGGDGRRILDRQRVEAAMNLEKQADFHTLQDQAIPPLMERLAGEICALLNAVW
jgi:hypothetical protein